MLIDTGFPQTLYVLVESLWRLGFRPSDIVYILRSHGHYDHCGGTRALVELTHAETFLGEADVEILKSRPELSSAPEYGKEFCERFAVDNRLRGGEVITLGEVSVECMHIPGHTPGSMAYFFEVQDGGAHYRVGINGGLGLNTLTDEYLAKYGLGSQWRTDYLQSLARMRERQVDITHGAHPAQNDTFGRSARVGQGPNPFADPNEWSARLDEWGRLVRLAFGTKGTDVVS